MASSTTDSPATVTMHPAAARAIAVEKALARLPGYDSAHISTDSKGVSTITASLSTRSDLSKSTKHFEQSYAIDARGNLVHTGQLAPVSAEIASSCISPAGDWRINLRSVEKSEKSGEKRIIEVVSSLHGIVAEIDVTDKHSTFLGGDTWGAPVWHPSQPFLAYVAEQHPPHWDSKDKPVDAYEYYPIAGEQLVKASKPAIFIVDLRDIFDIKFEQVTKTVKDTDTVYCQPVFGSDESKHSLVLYATGHDLLKSGRRLGIIFCTNRPAALYRLSFDLQAKRTKSECLSADDRATRCPAVLDGSVYYFSCRREYEHNSCHKLHRSKGAAKGDEIVVDSIWDADAEKDEFPGLFPPGLPRSCRLALSSKDGAESNYLAFSTQWRSQLRVITVHAKTGDVKSHTPLGVESSRLLCTDGKSRMLAISSTSVSPPKLVLGEAKLVDGQISISWQTLKAWTPALPKDVEVSHLQASLTREKGATHIETIVSTPLALPASEMSVPIESCSLSEGKGTAKNDAPLIIYLHGGPNGTSSTGWSSARFAFLCAGFAVAEINYPGSTGFGQKHIEELSKDCGNLDVESVVDAYDHLVKIGIASKEPGKTLYLGGSHSGFIGAHLSARWPDMFAGVVLSNPVIDMPSCFATSDIPDWSLAQFNIPYSFSDPPSFVPERHFKYLRDQSPSSHLEQLFSQKKKPCMPPTLLNIGEVDLRVPKNQGIAWYHALKGHGENVRMLYWPGNNHSLGEPWTRPKVFEAEVTFFVEHAKF